MSCGIVNVCGEAFGGVCDGDGVFMIVGKLLVVARFFYRVRWEKHVVMVHKEWHKVG